MKADISDAPERINQRRHKRGVLYTVLCLMAGSIATLVVLQSTSRAPSVDVSAGMSTSPNAEQAKIVRTGEPPPTPGLEPSMLQGSSAMGLPANGARQTVFNDKNFIPRGADNVVSLGVSPDPAPRKVSTPGVKLTIVKQTPSMKDRACWPFKQGSIESRNCRASIGLRHRD